MSPIIEVKFTDENEEEVVLTLPAKFEVCPRCEGHGTHLTESIGSHAFTQEDFEEAFPDDESRGHYLNRGGIYDVQCEKCGGKNVVPVVNRVACVTEEHKRALKILAKQEREEADYEQLVRSEQRAGC